MHAKDLKMSEENCNCFIINFNRAGGKSSYEKTPLTDRSSANERCHCRILGKPNTINKLCVTELCQHPDTHCYFFHSSLTDTVLSLDVFRKGLHFASCAKVSRHVDTITVLQTKSRNYNREKRYNGDWDV